MFKMQDIELTPQNYSFPVQEREKDISDPVYSTLLQQIYAYLQVTNIETDEDIIGFGLSNIKKEKYLKYDESWIISASMPGDVYTSGAPLCVITVQLSEKALTQKRQYTTLIEVLGYVGGLMEVLVTFVNMLLSFIIDNLYEKSVVNNLFEFDLDKKVIIIKEKENDKKINDFNYNNIPKIYSPRKNIPIVPQNSLYISEDTIQTRNKLNEDPLSKNRYEGENIFKQKYIKGSKRKRKMKFKMNNNFGRDDIYEVKNNNLYENVENKEEYNIYNQKNNFQNFVNSQEEKEIKETNKEKDNRKIIKKIKINKFCTYLCFFCARKRKSLENTLLDEGMNIVIGQLDVLNMFKKMYKEQNIQEKLKQEPIQMSDECKKKMVGVIKELNNS